MSTLIQIMRATVTAITVSADMTERKSKMRESKHLYRLLKSVIPLLQLKMWKTKNRSNLMNLSYRTN